jgi:hypothetical protein
MRPPLLLAFLLTGCVGLSDADCQSMDWYRLGRRDGEVYGSRAAIDQYRHQCAAHGVAPDEAAYALGWDDGNMEYRQRSGYGGGPD